MKFKIIINVICLTFILIHMIQKLTYYKMCGKQNYNSFCKILFNFSDKSNYAKFYELKQKKAPMSRPISGSRFRN